jgi:hypothetical protein
VAGGSPYWNPKTETLARPELEALQLAKLRGGGDSVADSLHRRLALALEGLNVGRQRAATGELPRFALPAKRTVEKRDVPVAARVEVVG